MLYNESCFINATNTYHYCYAPAQLKSARNRFVRSRSTSVATVAYTEVSVASAGEELCEVTEQLQKNHTSLKTIFMEPVAPGGTAVSRRRGQENF
jgi:hypothetical protein